MTPLLEFRDVGASYGQRWVWRHASFSIEPGEFVAVIGPNGAGKSTLLKLALGMLSPAEGAVLVNGRPARRGKIPVGYAPQLQPPDAEAAVRARDIVRFGVDGNRWGLPLPGAANTEANARVGAALAMVGAASNADRRTGELSGGELRRVLLAQALVRKPCLLALDEPTANLDTSSRTAFISLVAKLARGAHVAVLLVTHDLNGILPHLDRVICVARGSVDIGRPADVVTSEVLTRLYDVSIDVLRDSRGGIVISGSAG